LNEADDLSRRRWSTTGKCADSLRKLSRANKTDSTGSTIYESTSGVSEESRSIQSH